jgi:hypothetical protein
VAQTRDWHRWHDSYDDPQSPLSKRLEFVSAHLAGALNAAPPGPISLLSLCAGQGHDVLGVLPDHPRRADVAAVLVELDPANAELATTRAGLAGLDQVEVREADAAIVASYADALPADVLLLCGIFGNVADEDIHRTAGAAAGICRPGGTVIWTRHRREPDLTPQIRAWFAEAGFDEVAFEKVPTETLTGVGVGRLRGSPPRATHRTPGRTAVPVPALTTQLNAPAGSSRLIRFRCHRSGHPGPGHCPRLFRQPLRADSYRVQHQRGCSRLPAKPAHGLARSARARKPWQHLLSA